MSALSNNCPTSLESKKNRLSEILTAAQSLIVAYSGGVDSSLLTYNARIILGNKAKIVIAVSPSLAQDELQAAQEQAFQFNWNLIEINTKEVETEAYLKNDARRCYFCKAVLFEELEKMAHNEGIKHIAYGANLDDLKDFRPGHQAAREKKVLSPLQEAGLTKDEIRLLAKNAGLPSWNRPQAACLSSRFPTFEPITKEALSQIDAAESFLRQLQFRQVRVRHFANQAKIEVGVDEVARLEEKALRDRIFSALKELGYSDVAFDPEGYRQGSVNIKQIQEHK